MLGNIFSVGTFALQHHMTSICLYFHVHQPRRLKRYRVFDIGGDSQYFNDDSKTSLDNKWIIDKVSKKSYFPTNTLLFELLQRYPDFKISFSITGILLEQLEEYNPEALDSFKRLVDTGRVEIINETYHHSLSFIYSREEFRRQVEMQRKKIRETFGVTPSIFRNTELIYNNDLAKEIESLGYSGILAEGADHVLDWRSPNFLYSPPDTPRLKLLLKNYKLSDDIAFRFSSRQWSEYPLSAEKFANWVSATNGNADVVNLFMDYETFGEHQWEDSGIFEFFRDLPKELYKHPDNRFVTPTEAISLYRPVATLDIPNFISWADTERDLSAWLENPMQQDSIRKLYELEGPVLSSGDEALIRDWRLLQASDHFYYMCTKWWSDGDVHKYFSPYNSPYEAFVTFINVLNDLKLRLRIA